jgi:hypothetical protein
MKVLIAAALFFAPLAALAQDREAEELKRDMEKRLAELERSFNEQRARVKEEFARQLERMKQPERKPDAKRPEGTGLENLMERLERRLGDLDRRLGELERRMGGGGDRRPPEPPRPPQPPRQPEQAQKFFRQQFDFNNRDWQQWMEQGRRFWEGGGDARDALRGALDELKRMFDHDKKQPHIEDAMELLRKIIERRDHRDEERREEKRPAPAPEKKRPDRERDRNFF